MQKVAVNQLMGSGSARKLELESAWLMRQRVMYRLFDLARLITDDERRLHTLHNEIATICNETFDGIKRDVDARGLDEKRAVKSHFGLNQTNSNSCLIVRIGNLLRFIYGDDPARKVTIEAFMGRTHEIAESQYKAHYEANVEDGVDAR